MQDFNRPREEEEEILFCHNKCPSVTQPVVSKHRTGRK